MSVLIHGLEMPQEGFVEILIREDGTVQQTGQSYRIDGTDYYTPYVGEMPVIYKAVPVPPHGDLIDRDALRASIRESIEECHKWADEVDKDTMMYARISQSVGTFVECSLRAKAAPTIIPAEEGE